MTKLQDADAKRKEDALLKFREADEERAAGSEGRVDLPPKGWKP